MRKDVADACTIGSKPHGKHAVWRAVEGSALSELDRVLSVNLGGTRFLGGRYDQEKLSAPVIADGNCDGHSRLRSSADQTTPNDNTFASDAILARITASGDLILPKNFHEWVFVGAPLTPNALNGGKAGFPEYHNVYIEPGSYEIFKKTGEFPEGTIMFKELQLTLGGGGPRCRRDLCWN
jgi:Cytochrome P460